MNKKKSSFISRWGAPIVCVLILLFSVLFFVSQKERYDPALHDCDDPCYLSFEELKYKSEEGLNPNESLIYIVGKCYVNHQPIECTKYHKKSKCEICLNEWGIN